MFIFGNNIVLRLASLPSHASIIDRQTLVFLSLTLSLFLLKLFLLVFLKYLKSIELGLHHRDQEFFNFLLIC